ncbi:hypothetical protein HWC07_gp024 [Pantoea phage vB_PagM_LIET2]|uniref:Uncharacterized protein n=1 Tax=Pantoea phage vB_PagM_LIET2 TaxID=2508071 RepID=A0A411AW13_9CAUD|nr:hypothetical protein HWC07_gp024 [Pantoea phage vB_PagM_LIET2]QAX92276.1 hypothetical protein LIET2_gp024 [Pantoea phage vB_PagM_LIET2]
MAHMMKKADFLNLVTTMKEPRLKTFRGSVYLRDGDSTESEVEIYQASNMKEEGIISAMNQSSKYRGWMK